MRRMTPKSRTGIWILVAALTVLTTLVGACAVNPVTGKSQISLISPAQELEIGREGYGPVIREYGLYEDAELRAYVNAVGQKLARVSHLPDLEWHFTILDDPTVNAFAMPGGYIYITRGILVYLNSEAQLAGVLAHEIGHVTRRHSASQLTQQQLYGAGVALGSIISPTFQRYSGVAQTALGLLFLKYSRSDETQADELAVEYATKAGYDPREIPAVYAMIRRISDQSGQRLPGFLATHPDPGDRERITGELATQAVVGKGTLSINRDGHLAQADGVLFGHDPRQGYFDGDHYYHPNLGFQMTFPTGWKHFDSHSSVAAEEPNQAAVMQLSAAEGAGDLSPTAYVASLKTNGAIRSSNGANEAIGGYAAWVGHMIVGAEGQPPTTLDAAFVRKGTSLFQFLGRSASLGDAHEGRIFAAIRSFRALTEAARINVTPDRVRLRTVSTAGTFDAVARSLGAAAADVETDAIMNQVLATDRVAAGTRLKIVNRLH